MILSNRLISPLDLLRIQFETCDLIVELRIDGLTFLLKQVIDLVQTSTSRVDPVDVGFCLGKALSCGGLIQTGEYHVSNLTHGEHTRLLESIRGHIFFDL